MSRTILIIGVAGVLLLAHLGLELGLGLFTHMKAFQIGHLVGGFDMAAIWFCIQLWDAAKAEPTPTPTGRAE